MSRLARIVPVLAALVCGVLAGRVLWSPLPDGFIRADSALPDALVANGAGVAVAAVVAVLVTAPLTRRRSVALTAAVAVVGLLLSALPDVVRYPSEPAVLLYANAVAGGLVLAATAHLTTRDEKVQGALAAGMIGAFLLAGLVVEFRRFGTDPGGRLFDSPFSAEPVGAVGVWPAVAAAALVVLTVLVDRRTPPSGRIDSGWLATAVALPVVAFAAGRILVDAGARPEWWYPYVVVTVALAAWIAWRLPASDGRLVFAGTAVLAAVTVGVPWPSADWWTVGISCLLIGAGVVVGLRWPSVVAGFLSAALTVAAMLVDSGSADFPAAGYQFVLPAVAGYLVGSCLPSSAPAVTVGLSIPFAIGIPGLASTTWSLGERYSDVASVVDRQVAASVPAVVVAVAVVLVCGVGAWGLDLRSGAR